MAAESSAESLKPERWNAGLTRKHWRVLTGSYLGWLFDGYETFALIIVLPFAMASLLTPEQRASFLETHVEAQLEGLQHTSNRLSAEGSLFDRFAGIFHAFGCLRRFVFEALEEDRPADELDTVMPEEATAAIVDRQDVPIAAAVGGEG